MGVSEIAYRIKNKIQSEVEQLGYGLAKKNLHNKKTGFSWCKKPSKKFNIAIYKDSADLILNGKFNVFALKKIEVGFPPNWNKDPKTGKIAPLVFGKTMNYRNENIVGDIKYLWEPNRHSELVTLAQAWYLTGDEKYAEGCKILLTSWFKQCPYPLGVNWTSSLEHAIRLINWSVAWTLLSEWLDIKNQDKEEFINQWLDSVYKHCHFISRHFSRYSSANNHLLGELLGLFVASGTWPYWKESKSWSETSIKEFEKEALKQTTQDGVNREQAIWYHHEVLDMMILASHIAKTSNNLLSQEFWGTLEKMIDFIAAIMDAKGNVPMIGDSDDARIVRWVPEISDNLNTSEFDRDSHRSVYKSLLATGSVLFNRSDLALKAGCYDEKSRWLLGDSGEEKFESLKLEKQPNKWPQIFPEGGYYVLGSNLDTPTEVRLVVDAAPLGYLSIAAHGHADALAFTLSIGGQEILIDPGTFAYHTQKVWRDYFRGTSAHNTLRVDKTDQSEICGNFMWKNHANARCVSWCSEKSVDRWVGEHDGYQRLGDPAKLRREIVLQKNNNIIEINDTVIAKMEHEIELFWHFDENCSVSYDGKIITVNKQNVQVCLNLPTTLEVNIFKGEETVPLGWISRSFDQKSPCTTVVAKTKIVGDWHGTSFISYSFCN